MNTDASWLSEYWELCRYAKTVLGVRGWSLLRGYGKMMHGLHSGEYVSALPFATTGALIDALARGDEVDVHLMHRHRSGNYESSTLRLVGGVLVMQFSDRDELA